MEHRIINPLTNENKRRILGQEHRRLLAIIDYLTESSEHLSAINSSHATEITDVRNHLIHIKNKILNTKESLEYTRKIDNYLRDIYPNIQKPKDEGSSGS